MPPTRFSVGIRASLSLELRKVNKFHLDIELTANFSASPNNLRTQPDSKKLLVHSSHIRTLKQFKLFLFTQEKIISFGGNL